MNDVSEGKFPFSKKLSYGACHTELVEVCSELEGDIIRLSKLNLATILL